MNDQKNSGFLRLFLGLFLGFCFGYFGQVLKIFTQNSTQFVTTLGPYDSKNYSFFKLQLFKIGNFTMINFSIILS